MEDKDKKEQLPIVDQIKEYLETYIRLVRLKAIERGTSVFANIITDIFIILGLCLTILFLSITIALYLGYILNSYWEGFGIVSLAYLLVILFAMVFRKSLERPIVNALIRKLFK